MTATRLAAAGIIAIAAIFVVLYCRAVSPYWKLTPDSTTYVLGAESLAEGKGYREGGAPAELFPPGTSLLMAAAWVAGGHGYRALNAEVMLFALASLAICFLLFREPLGVTGSGAVVLLCMGSAEFFDRSTYLLSEIFFLFFSLLALWLYRRGSMAGTVLSSVAAVMVRSVGVCLAAALVLDSLRKRPRKWTQAAGYALPLLFALGWEIRNRLLGWSYTELMTENEPWVRASGHMTIGRLLARLIANRAYGRPLASVMTNGLTQDVVRSIWPAIAMAGVMALGFWRLTWKRDGIPAAGIYTILFAIAVALYWPEVFVRLFLPLLPLLFAYLVAGVQEVGERTNRWSIYPPAAILLAWYLSIGYGADRWLIAHDRQSMFPGQSVVYTGSRDVQSLALWWKEHATESDVYACEHPNIINIITGRSGVSYAAARQPEALETGLRSKGARYLLLNMNSGADREVAGVAERSVNLRLVRQEGQARLYELTE